MRIRWTLRVSEDANTIPTLKACTATSTSEWQTRELFANVNDVDLLAAFDAETVVRHLNEVVPEGGIIVDSQQLNTKVLDIPTLPPEFKDEIRKFMKENNVGETVNDWLEYAKKEGVQVFPVPYSALLNQIGQKLGSCSNQQNHPHDKRLNNRRLICALQVRPSTYRESGESNLCRERQNRRHERHRSQPRVRLRRTNLQRQL